MKGQYGGCLIGFSPHFSVYNCLEKLQDSKRTNCISSKIDSKPVFALESVYFTCQVNKISFLSAALTITTQNIGKP